VLFEEGVAHVTH